MPDETPPPPAAPSLKRVAFIGSGLPRQCGIATFTGDLVDALCTQYGNTEFFQVAVNDVEQGYDYPARVRFEMAASEIASYRRAADFLNINNVDVVCLQHEFGLFGGPAGSHILALARDLRMPLVVTFHTVLDKPDQYQRKVVQELVQVASRVTTLSRRGVNFLHEIYGAPEAKLGLLHHGIPDIPFVDPNFYKDQFGVEGKFVLETFGLLAPNKGIEHALKALPAIIEHNPNVVYLIVGATHPHLLRREGESYRLELQEQVQELGLENNVIFYNRFVSAQELMEFMCAADIYVSPYPKIEQISSGTLAYALGTGKAIVSTPYWYAEEMLAEERGMLFPAGDSKALAARVIELLDNETLRHAMRKRAYLQGRVMIWPRVAQAYYQSFEQVKLEQKDRARQPRALGRETRELPLLKLDHLRRMTDRTGMLQHAVFSIPNFSEGYCTDDNARALALAVLLKPLKEVGVAEAGELAAIYMAFLWYAFDPKTNLFRNFLSFDRKWIDEKFHEDCHARALWALAMVLGHSRDSGLVGTASNLFERALKPSLEFTAPRAWAFAIMATHQYLRRFSGDRGAQQACESLAGRLLECYQRTSSPDWLWFEDSLTYDNANLSQALLQAGERLNRPEMTEAGLKSLEWLVKIQRGEDHYFVPIGSNGFYPRGGTRARFDQQPLEAYATVSACLQAHRVTNDARWQREAQRAFDWFLGRNDLRQPVYDPVTGGCRDGLRADRLNNNEGAESTLVCLLAQAEMRLAQYIIRE